MLEGLFLIPVGVLRQQVRSVHIALVLFSPSSSVVVGASLLQSLEHLSYMKRLTDLPE